MNIKTLCKASCLLAFLQIMSYSCGCPPYYVTCKLANHGMSRFVGQGVGAPHNTRWVKSGEYNSAWEGVKNTIEAPSLLVSFKVGVEYVEEMPVAALAGFSTMAYATPPCKPNYYESIDSIMSIEVFTTDSLGALGPGASILGKGNWNENMQQMIRVNHQNHAGPWLNVDIVLPKEEGEYPFGLKMSIQTTTTLIEIESERIYWK